MKSLVSILVISFSLVGCGAGNLVSITSRPELVQVPPVGEVRTSELGDSLTKTARVAQLPALRLVEEVVAKGSGIALGNSATIKPGVLVARYSTSSGVCYMAQEPVEVGNLLARNSGQGGLCVNNSNPKFIQVLVRAPAGSFFYEPKKAPVFERSTYIDTSVPGFQQELIYNGRASDAVKFLYRELSNDMARPAFTQEVQYDLREGTTVGFKGTRIEVLDATNITIKYRVLAHFPVPQ